MATRINPPSTRSDAIDGDRFAVQSGMSSPLAWFLDLLRNWRRRQRFRRLLNLNDRMLRDIGVTRAEVEQSAELPLGINASLELRMLSRHRIQRQRAGTFPW